MQRQPFDIGPESFDKARLQQQPVFSDAEIFTKIWFSPRKILRFVNDTHHEKFLFILLFLAGVSRAFDRASIKDFGDKLSLPAIIGICVILGGLFGWISYLIYAAFINWTGKLLKGQGGTRSIFRVMAYATIPSAFGLLLLIPQIGVYGNECFMSDGDLTNAGLLGNLVFWGAYTLEFILALWTLVLFVVGVSEVQKFSIWRAILNILLPVLFIVLIVLLILLFVKLFF